MGFGEYDDILEKLEKIIKEWDVRANFFYNLVKGI